MYALVRMNSPQKNQIIAARVPKRIQRKVNTVVHGRQIVQSRRAIRVADGYKIPVAVLLIDRHDLGRRESVDGGEDWCSDEPCVGERHKVVVAVDQVELRSVFKSFGNVKVFGYFGIDAAILLISFSNHSVETSTGHRIPGGEQCHIPATSYESFGNVTGHGFPGAVLSRRSSPGDRR